MVNKSSEDIPGVNKTITVHDFTIVSPISELGTIVLVAAGILGLTGIRRRY